jgi:hypothetical protein
MTKRLALCAGLILTAGAAAAQTAPRPDQQFTTLQATDLVAILNVQAPQGMNFTGVTVSDASAQAPTVRFTSNGNPPVTASARLVNCNVVANQPTRCAAISYSVCWTRAEYGRDLPDAAAINTINLNRVAGWLALDTRGTEPRICFRHAHSIRNGVVAVNIRGSAIDFVNFANAARRAPPQAAPATPAPATPPQAAPATPPAVADPWSN